jgi:3-hydroxybutyryl-CoA dehydrogenase
MGAGIATSLAMHGVTVQLVDKTAEAAANGARLAENFWNKAAEKGRITPEAAQTARGNLAAGADLAALAGCDLVIEAVFEQFDAKAAIFRDLDSVLPPACVVATNTSALRVTELAETLSRPERFLGLHYFNPAAVNPVVEVVRGARTSPDIYNRCIDFCRMTGKMPLPCLDSYGFAINRFFIPYGNEAVRLADEGIGHPAQVDRVAQDCLGAAAGPFVVINLVKPRIMLHAQQNLAPHGRFYTPAASLVKGGDRDYSFEIPPETGSATAAADALIADRLRGAVFFPVLQALDEKVASPADIDMGAQQALRFGKAPCALMDSLGRAEVERLVHLVIRETGQTPPASLDRVGKLLKP